MACIALVTIVSCSPSRPTIVYLPPSVTLDSSTRARRNVAVVSASRTFWEAMASLDTGFVTRQKVTEPEEAFARALGSIMSGRAEEAAFLLDSIRAGTSDSLVRSASRVLMTAMLQYQDKWKLLAELNVESPRDSLYDRAGVESWASAFKGVAARQIEFPPNLVVLPLTLCSGDADDSGKRERKVASAVARHGIEHVDSRV